MGADTPEQNRRDRVLAELERILASPAFRGSRRSQEFLRYIVTNALDGRSDMLKERCLGVGVFGRPADYDTGDDAIVRVKASEVRKRLAQYYLESGGGGAVQIELPSGSYTPEIRIAAMGPASPRPARRRRWFAAVAALGLLVGAGWLLYPRRDALDRFWEPVERSRQPVLLCVAHPTVFTLSARARQLVDLVPPQPGAQVSVAEIFRQPDHYVGVGDALTVANLARFFGQRGKPAQVRMGIDTSFTDLRNSLAVLIGAYSNQWTMQVANDLRFGFDRDAEGGFIHDRMDPSVRWANRTANPPTDHVIVSRVFDSKTGEVVITAAGLSHFGTRAAGEFLTDPGYFKQAVEGAPSDWPRRNMQLVLRVEVIGNTPGPPRVLARYFW